MKSDNTLEVRPVESRSHRRRPGVGDGSEPDETIAGDNFNRLQEGMAVTERKAASAATPATTNAAETPKGQKP